MVAVDFVNGQQIIITEQDYNKACCSHVTKRGYTEILAKPTKYVGPIELVTIIAWHSCKVSSAYATCPFLRYVSLGGGPT